MNIQFNESSLEFLYLNTVLNFKNLFISINNYDIYKFTIKFYFEDFTNQDVIILEYKLVYYKLDVIHNL